MRCPKAGCAPALTCFCRRQPHPPGQLLLAVPRPRFNLLCPCHRQYRRAAATVSAGLCKCSSSGAGGRLGRPAAAEQVRPLLCCLLGGPAGASPSVGYQHSCFFCFFSRCCRLPTSPRPPMYHARHCAASRRPACRGCWAAWQRWRRWRQAASGPARCQLLRLQWRRSSTSSPAACSPSLASSQPSGGRAWLAVCVPHKHGRAGLCCSLTPSAPASWRAPDAPPARSRVPCRALRACGRRQAALSTSLSHTDARLA